MSDAALLMDKMYRYQRYIYDLTRKPYLLGRDQMIAALRPPKDAAILEIGCGTGRNLVLAAQAYPKAQCFGLDVSAEMLETAKISVEKAGLAKRIHLAQADATNFAPQTLFGQGSFDRIFISYSLSMIPAWQQVLAEAVTHLAPNGVLHIVDFGQQERLPRWFRAVLFKWLSWFSVHPRADLPEEARRLAMQQGLICSEQQYFGGYALHVTLRR